MNPLEIKNRYQKGENITRLLRGLKGVDHNTDEIIELAYDLQSGTYVEDMKDNADSANSKIAYIKEVVDVIKMYFPEPKSLLKGGAGECVTLVPILKEFNSPIEQVRGIDMCWSRLAYGKRWLKENKLDHVELAMGTLSKIPFVDNAFDIVVTSHSMEPNGGREEEILSELYRVAGNYLFISEPSYELASREGKTRMDKLGYVKGLEETASRLGYNVVANHALKNLMNKLNPTSVIVISKNAEVADAPHFACPSSKKKLTKYESCYYSNEYLCAYPVIEGIPCLRTSAAVLTSKLPEIQGNA